MLVELDLFSGRPNPTWHLSETGAARLRQLVASLPVLPEGERGPTPPGLGYRGFRVTDSGPEGDASLLAYGGVVRTPQAILADPGHRTERMLADHMPEELHGLRRALSSETWLGGRA